MKNKRYYVIALILFLIACLGIYGWPRNISQTLTLTWVDRSNGRIVREAEATVEGSTYHRFFRPDTFNGILTIDDRLYRMTSSASEGMPSPNDLYRKWHDKGIEVTLQNQTDNVGMAVLSKRFNQLSGYFDDENSRDIMFAGPASSYEEANGLIETLFLNE